MKNWKNRIIISIVILFIILISGCSEPTTHLLDGTWTLSTTQIAGGDIGSGTFTLTFVEHFLVDIYMGSGTLSGGAIAGPYTVTGVELDGPVSFQFSDGSDWDNNGKDDILDFQGTLSGNTVTGTYFGWPGGAFEAYSGDFTATKQ